MGIHYKYLSKSNESIPFSLKRLLREPLLHFVIVGTALFVAGRIYQHETTIYKILITPQHVALLGNQYALQFGAPPDSQTLEHLISRDIHDEILFRKGLALKLDRNDQIVRRRIVQKMQFLMQDLNIPAEPTESQLQAYYTKHATRYVKSPRATFSHIFFSTDNYPPGQDGDSSARQRAVAVLGTLANSRVRAPELGDPFPDLYDFSAYEPAQVNRLFGHSSFSRAVFSAPIRKWAGPFRSGYGWHLVFIDARQSARQPPLSAVREAVRTDLLKDAREKANAVAYAELAQRFTIVREDQVAAP